MHLRPFAALWAVCGGRFQKPPTENHAGFFFLVPLSSRAADLVLFLMRSGRFACFLNQLAPNDVNKIPK